MKNRINPKGFTLVEILPVIFVLLLILTIGFLVINHINNAKKTKAFLFIQLNAIDPPNGCHRDYTKYDKGSGSDNPAAWISKYTCHVLYSQLNTSIQKDMAKKGYIADPNNKTYHNPSSIESSAIDFNKDSVNLTFEFGPQKDSNGGDNIFTDDSNVSSLLVFDIFSPHIKTN